MKNNMKNDKEEGEMGKKCEIKDGMMICYCGKCEPENYSLPKDFPKCNCNISPNSVHYKNCELILKEKSKEEEKGWRTQFNELRPFNSCTCYQCNAKVEGFIFNLLQSQKSKLEQEINEKMPREKEIPDILTKNEQCVDVGFNLCLQEVKTVINAIFKN